MALSLTVTAYLHVPRMALVENATSDTKTNV